MEDQEKSVSFGFRQVPEAQKASLVGKVFSEVAESYDLMNDMMSGGVHRLWKNFMIEQISPRPQLKILDVAGGTGDISFRMVKKFKDSKITLCDINQEMLDVGQKRAIDRGITSQIEWVCGDACQLDFVESTYDLYTIAFGLRNVTDIPAALSEAYRVLKPGGQYMCQEFSQVVLPGLREAYDSYSFKVIPKIGKYIAKNEEAYQYLVESIARFPNQSKLEGLMKQAGFENVKHINLAGGIASLHIGWKI